MKRLLVVGLIGWLLCSGMVWAQYSGAQNMAGLMEDDPNDPNTPPVEFTTAQGDPNDPNDPPVEINSGLVMLSADPNDPNTPPVEWSILVGSDSDPNDPNTPPVE